MIKTTVLLILGYMLTAPLAIAAAPHQPELASADWSVNALHNLAKDPPSKKAVWNFMINFWGDAWVGQGKLCSFRFVNLHHSSTLSLVTIYDWGGSLDCSDLTIFEKSPTGTEGFDFDGPPLLDDDVKEVVKELRGNGQIELVVRTYSAPTGEDLWPNIYAWTGDGYANVSSQYPDYYRTWLISLNKEIANMESERSSLSNAMPEGSAQNSVVIQGGSVIMNNSFPLTQPTTQQSVSPEIEVGLREQIDDKQALAAKIERFLGSKDARMLDAIRWANSNDPRERKLAVQAFADMNTSEAQKYEQTLNRDADPNVAKLASSKIKYWNKQDPYRAASFNLVTPQHPVNR